MKSNQYRPLFIVTGLAVALLGLFMVKHQTLANSTMYFAPYLMVSFGCLLFGSSTGDSIAKKVTKDYPDISRQIDIEEKDERNMAIANLAKAKAYNMMVSTFGALMIALALMKTDLTVILLLGCTYLFVVFYGIYFRMKYEREM